MTEDMTDFQTRLVSCQKLWDKQKTDYAEKTGVFEEVGRSYADAEKRISIAKNRLQYKDEVAKLLEEFQQNAFSKSIGLYNDILNDNSRAVIEHADEIRLVPVMAHGNPGLKLITTDADGNELDLFKDAPGSVRNIAAILLRAIAVRVAGLRPFMSLDEPDHWISRVRTEKFFNQVGRDLCTTQKFQILVISHHPATIFEDLDARIISVIAKGKKTSDTLVVNKGDDWVDEKQVGIRYIMLKNVAQFKNTFIPLSPGLNVMMGDNGIGKSRITRALRAILLGDEDASDSIIRHGETSCEITLGIENERKLVWSRDKKRNPKMHWALYDKDGDICIHNGEECSGSDSRLPPQWVFDIMNIKKVHDMDLQLVEQHDSLFILNKKPSERAKILNIGSENNLPASMIQNHKKQVSEDRQTIKELGKELSAMEDRLKILEVVRDIAPNMDEVNNLLDTVSLNIKDLTDVDTLGHNIFYGKKLVRKLTVENDVLKHIPEVCDFDKDMKDIATLEKMVASIEKKKSTISLCEKNLDVLKHIPDVDSLEFPSVGVIVKLIQSIEKNTRAIDYYQKERIILNDIPDVPDSLSSTVKIGEFISKIANKQSVINRLNKENDVLSSVYEIDAPEELPKIKNIDNLINRMQKSKELLKAKEQEAKEIDAQLSELYIEIGKLTVDGCPLCGSHEMNHAHLYVEEE